MMVQDSQLSTWPLDEQAAYWLRMVKDNPTPECNAALERWLNVSSDHAREFALAQEVDERLRRFHRKSHIDVDTLVERSLQEQRSSRHQSWAAGIAASLAVLALLLGGLFIFHDARDIYVTKDSQQLIDLEDGSVVAMQAGSRMQVAFSAEARDLYLESGQAIFRVRHDPNRPFRVHAGSAVVEAIGTQFDVRLAGDHATVAVIEGIVQLKPGSAPARPDAKELPPVELTRITAGQSATVRRDGRTEEVKAIDMTAVGAWRRPAEQLEFKNKPLGEIASEFNRHNAAPKLRIEGDQLRDRRFLLVFRNASPQSLLNYLAQDSTLEFVHEGDDIVIRERNH